MKKSSILEEEDWLNENFSKLPVTEKQKIVAEKYKKVKMNLRFTPDGESWSIWHDGKFHSIGILSKIEPDESGIKIDCIIDGDKVTLFTKPQNEEQEIIFKNYQYLKNPIYFYDCKGFLPCIINEKNELEQLWQTSCTALRLYPNFKDSDIVFYQDSSDYEYTAPISYKQQRVNMELNNIECKVFFSANGIQTFIYTSDKKICEVIEKTETINEAFGVNEYYDLGNGFIIIEIDEKEKHFETIKDFVELL